MTKKSISAIYCDDIRPELGGKTSFMGVYNDDIAFPQFPSTLQKLCAHVKLRMPYVEPPKHEVRIVLLNGEQVLAEAKIDEAALEAAPMPMPDEKIAAEDRSLVLAMVFVISPFQVDGPMIIRLRAYVDGEEVKGNGLRIRAATAEELKTLEPAVK